MIAKCNGIQLFFVIVSAYRFQLAGYRDEREYLAVTKSDTVSSEIFNRSLTVTIYLCLHSFALMLTRWSGGRTTTTSRSCVAETVISTTTTRPGSVQRKTCRKSNSTCTEHTLNVLYNYVQHRLHSAVFIKKLLSLLGTYNLTN